MNQGTSLEAQLAQQLHELEENRSALLFMLEDLEASRDQIERAHHEWIAALDSIRSPIFIHDAQFHILKANLAYADRAGMKFRQFLGKPYWEIFPKGAGPMPGCSRAMEDQDRQHEDEIVLDSGEVFLSRSYGVTDKQGNYLYSVHVMDDITERRSMEENLRKSEKNLKDINRTLATLSACNLALVRATDEAQLLDEMCRLIVEIGGYATAWVVYSSESADNTVEPMASAGVDIGFLRSLGLSWKDTAPGQNPCERAMRDSRAATIALPLREEKHVFGALNICTSHPGGYSPDEIKLLEELANDLAFGILSLRNVSKRKQAEDAHRKSQEKLRKALVDTIKSISTTLEMRDPYTAGHQNRVAELAAAIAREIGLSPETVEGIRLGSLIHDIGKIRIPAEILSKPGRLSNIEFELIKAHPGAGGEILKDIEFPWPIARMIVEHHERLDGSGYPKALKGEEISLEARILAVADVVEAMTTHRPYRAGLGIHAALAEIEAKRGKCFDGTAVDACLKLFREKNLRIEGLN